MRSMPHEAELSQQLRQAREQLDALRLENQLLRQKLDALARRVFGKSSEQLDAEMDQWRRLTTAVSLVLDMG